MKVLITGATGFVGQKLTNYLVAQGLEVRVLARKPLENNNSEIEVFLGDVIDPDSLDRATKNVDGVFHLAGVVGYSKAQRQEMYNVNVLGTKNVIHVCKKNNIKRLLHFSSVVAVGASFDGKKPLDENSTYNIHHLNLGYFETKHEAEKLILESHRRDGLDVVCVNPSTIYGYGDALKGSRKIQVKVAQGKFPFYPSGGVNIVAVEDVVEATLKAFQLGRSGERYILAGENISVKKLFELIAQESGVAAPKIPLPKNILLTLGKLGDFLEILNQKGPINSENAWASSLYHWFDNSKAKRELQLSPKPATFAIHNSVQWMKDNGLIADKTGTNTK